MESTLHTRWPRSLPAPALRYDARVADSPAPLIAGDVLTLPELRHLRRVSGLRGAGLVLHAWAVIIGAMGLYVAWPSAVTLVLAIALIGARQLGLAVLMHEAAHWRLYPARAEHRIAHWFGATPAAPTSEPIAAGTICIIATRARPTIRTSGWPRPTR